MKLYKIKGTVYIFNFDGKIDSDEKGFLFAKWDVYLNQLKDKLDLNINRSIMDKKFNGIIKILSSKVFNPPSEGYPNSLQLIVVLSDDKDKDILLDIIKEVEKDGN